jgi:hypothetical protein
MVWTATASAQFAGYPVFDVGVYGQMLFEVAHSLELINLAVRNLAPLVQVSLAFDLVVELQAIITDVDGITRQIEMRLGVYQGQRTLPSTWTELSAFRRQLEGMCQQSRMDAFQAQLLLRRMTTLLTHLRALLNTFQQILGTVAGLQAASIELAAISAKLVLMQAQQAAHNEAILCQEWAASVRRQSIEQLQYQALRDYAVWPNR